MIEITLRLSGKESVFSLLIPAVSKSIRLTHVYQMREQTSLAVEEADVIVFLMDGKEGMLPPDIEVSHRLRASGKPVIYAVNKLTVYVTKDCFLTSTDSGLMLFSRCQLSTEKGSGTSRMN